MKKLETFIVRNIAGDYIMMPVGETALKFSGMITANATGAFIWEHMENVNSAAEMANLLQKEFEVTHEKALEDCEYILGQMKKAGWIE